MTVMTKNDWIKNTTLVLMNGIPGYDYTTAADIVTTYLANDAGGWVPADVGIPNGNGEPDNGDTPVEAANAIITEEFATVNTLTSSFKLDITVKDVGSFAAGTSASTAFSELQSRIEARLSAVFDEEISLTGFYYTGQSSSLRTGGVLTESNRTSIATEINSASNITDPAAIATIFVRQNYGLNNTWMASKLYTRDNYPIVVYVSKYTSTSYATLDVSYVSGDDTITYQGYIVHIDPVTMKVQTCLVSPSSTTT